MLAAPGTAPELLLPRETTTLTDDEGTFLSLLIRVGPATAYQISKIYADSPVSNFGTSKGKIYPLIRRLRELGLVRAHRVEGDARGSERLECTGAGIEAARHWVKEIRPAHVLLEDPLRTKVQSFDLLTPRERLQWIRNAKEALLAKLRELEDYAAEVDVPFKELVHDNAVASVECRLEWLDRVTRNLEANAAAQPPAKRRRG
jgi:DNA-binding PadR family transcriptional regulator